MPQTAPVLQRTAHASIWHQFAACLVPSTLQYDAVASVASACVHPVLSRLCLSVCPAVFVCVCLFVDEGAEDKVGPLRHCPGCGPTASREWRKRLAPSISVSVPDDEPYNSDEEYYEHPLFSSEWTGSSTRPSATVKSTEVLLGHDEGELSMVPCCSSSPLPTCHPFHYICAWGCSFLGREDVCSPHTEMMPLQSPSGSKQSCSMSHECSSGVSGSTVPAQTGQLGRSSIRSFVLCQRTTARNSVQNRPKDCYWR